MKERINRERLYRTLTTLDIFVDKALGLKPKSEKLSGFHYNSEYSIPLLPTHMWRP